MIVFKKIEDLNKHLFRLKEAGKTIGFVPTMGALHEGHISLIKLAQSHSDYTVCSIFVNPTQFNDENDFKKYPNRIDQDIHLLASQKTDILFLPSVNEMYPNGTSHLKSYQLGYLENLLEGVSRPGHYQGVCLIVDRLLSIIDPDFLFLGQKDFQQIMVIKKMIALKEHRTEVIIAPTQRDPNGLANSSRNLRLSEKEKQLATGIFKSLTFIKDNFKKRTVSELIKNAGDILIKNHFHPIDYISIADAKTLQPITIDHDNNPDGVIALIAAYMGDVRLIDNMLL